MLTSKSFLISMMFALMYCITEFIINAVMYFGEDINAVWSSAYLSACADFTIYPFEIFKSIYPLIVVLPFACSYINEKSRNLLPAVFCRVSKKEYYYSKLVAVFISGVIVIFIPFIINYILNLIAFPLNSNIDFSGAPEISSHMFLTYIDEMMFGKLFLINPNIYILFYIFVASFFGGLIATAVFQFSFFFNRYSIIITCSAFIVQGIITILNIGDVSFDITNYIFAGQLYCRQSYTMFAVLTAIYIALAFAPCFFVQRKLDDLI